MSTGDHCTLCELPLAETAVETPDGTSFCCPGCRHVYETLDERPDLSVEEGIEQLDDEPAEDIPEGYETTFLRIDGMHCATCETFVESQAQQDEAVAAVDASYITDTVRVSHDPEQVGTEDLCDSLTGLGYRAYEKDDPLGKRQAEDRLLYQLIVGLVFGMMVMLNYVIIIYPTYFEHGLYAPPEVAAFMAEMLDSTGAQYFYLVLGFLTSIVLFVTGNPILKGAYVSLKTRRPNMDLLVALAAISAWAYSTLAIFVGDPHMYYDVTVGIILVVTVGSYYENQIKRQATETLADLTTAQVDEARLHNPDGQHQTVSVSNVAPGDHVLIREGERVPVDGLVVDGEGTVDEAVVTGESLPVPKTANKQVIGGSLLQDGSLIIEVGEDADSSIARITDMVWNLQSANHGIQQLADRLATIFVPLVLVLAVVVGTIHFLALGASVSATMLVALTVLIVSCPCALGLATPLAIASSVREALERGIVVFDETIFERLRDVDVVVFDKTGTLTTGEMRVIEADGPTELFERAALLETHSSHPIAAAVATEFAAGKDTPPESVATDGGVTSVGESDSELAGPDEPSPRVTSFESHANGVSGVVDGERILVGNPDLFANEGWTVPESLSETANEVSAAGNVPVIVGEGGTAIGLAAVGDDPREEWDAVIDWLDEQGIEVAVLTGDDDRAADRFRAHPGIDEVFAGVPPEAKAETVNRLGAGKQTVMVGDGTNDAPALATADLGIALGSGTALAADAADVAIVTDDLSSLETVFDLASAANKRVKQNIGWAFCYNGIAIPLAITGLINPLFAAVAMAISSTLVVTNSSRQLLKK